MHRAAMFRALEGLSFQRRDQLPVTASLDQNLRDERMFHAVITPQDMSRGAPVELSGEADPYDIQMLREQLLLMVKRRGSLNLQVRTAVEFRPQILAWLGDVSRRGVLVLFDGRS